MKSPRYGAGVPNHLKPKISDVEGNSVTAGFDVENLNSGAIFHIRGLSIDDGVVVLSPFKHPSRVFHKSLDEFEQTYIRAGYHARVRILKVLDSLQHI